MEISATNIPHYLHSSQVNFKQEKSDIVKFYQGFQHFWKMNVEEGYIIYILPSCNLVAGAKLEADKRIEEMGLNLETVGTGKMSSTFIVKQIGGIEE